MGCIASSDAENPRHVSTESSPTLMRSNTGSFASPSIATAAERTSRVASEEDLAAGEQRPTDPLHRCWLMADESSPTLSGSEASGSTGIPEHASSGPLRLLPPSFRRAVFSGSEVRSSAPSDVDSSNAGSRRFYSVTPNDSMPSSASLSVASSMRKSRGQQPRGLALATFESLGSEGPAERSQTSVEFTESP